MTIAAGRTLGSYENTGALDTDGMGEVYLAHDTNLGATWLAALNEVAHK
jgi:hypothetical protein